VGFIFLLVGRRGRESKPAVFLKSHDKGGIMVTVDRECTDTAANLMFLRGCIQEAIGVLRHDEEAAEAAEGCIRYIADQERRVLHGWYVQDIRHWGKGGRLG